MRHFLHFSIVLFLLLSACVGVPAPSGSESSPTPAVVPTSGNERMRDEEKDTTKEEAQGTKPAPGPEAGSKSPVGENSPPALNSPRMISIAVQDFSFAPNPIRARKGDTLQLNGISGRHGFNVPELGIDVEVSAGETKTVVITTDQTGTFALRCSIVCGSGHRDMTGTLIIEE
jgi:cytochrome c oxidase subunit II